MFKSWMPHFGVMHETKVKIKKIMWECFMPNNAPPQGHLFHKHPTPRGSQGALIP